MLPTPFIGLPRVIDAIDFTHILIPAHLGETEGDYVNR